MIIRNDDMKMDMSFCDGVSWHVHGVTVDKHEIYQDNWSQTEISDTVRTIGMSHIVGSYM